MLSPFTVANCPLTALPVRIVKLSPMTGTKPLISLTESVPPPRLRPFETATSPNVPAVLPPIEIFSVAVELWVKLPWIESVAGFKYLQSADIGAGLAIAGCALAGTPVF